MTYWMIALYSRARSSWSPWISSSLLPFAFPAIVRPSLVALESVAAQWRGSRAAARTPRARGDGNAQPVAWRHILAGDTGSEKREVRSEKCSMERRLRYRRLVLTPHFSFLASVLLTPSIRPLM